MIAALKGPGEVEVEILMTRQAHKGSFLVIEGPDDSRFWGPRVPEGQCEIVVGGGKPAVVGAIQRLDKCSFQGAVGLVDNDCDRLQNLQPLSPNLVYTDVRDLEGVLFRSSALSKVLAEYGDATSIKRFEARGETVMEALLKRALPLGRLRWLSYKLGKDLNFKHLKPAQFMDEKTWTFDEQALFDAVDSQNRLPLQPQLQVELAALTCSDPWQACQGHDLVDILGVGLCQVLGNRNPGRKKIGAVLRAGLESHEFTALQLYQDLRTWETTNSPYRILK